MHISSKITSNKLSKLNNADIGRVEFYGDVKLKRVNPINLKNRVKPVNYCLLSACFFNHASDGPSAGPLSTRMSEQVKQILDVPRDFIKDGAFFLNRCTKPSKRGDPFLTLVCICG